MNAAALLSQVDTLPFRLRLRVLAEQARTLPATGPLPPLLVRLLEGDRSQREMALFMATVAGRSDVVRASLQDPDHGIRSLALGTWVRTALSDAAPTALALLADAPAETRQRLYRLIRAYGRTDLAEELIDDVRARFSDAEAARLLASCGAGTVERLLADLGHAVGWSGLAARHPDALLREATRQLAELNLPGRIAWWSRFA